MRFALSLLALVSASASLAADKVLIAPVQAAASVDAALAVEVEEAARSGAMKQAMALDLLIMSHATLMKSMDALRGSSQMEPALAFPCESVACDAALGRALGTSLVVSTRLTKLDGKYLALLKLMGAKDDRVIASASAEADTFGSLLPEITRQAERMMSDGRAAAPKPRVVEDRVLRTGYLTLKRDGQMMGNFYECTLSTTELACKTAGLFASGERLTLPFTEVTGVYTDGGGGFGIATTTTKYSVGMMNRLEVDRRASAWQKAQEQQRIVAELYDWKRDVDGAWQSFRGR